MLSLIFGFLLSGLVLQAPAEIPQFADKAEAKNAQDVPVFSLDDLRRRIHDNSPVMDMARAVLARYEAIFDHAYYAWTPTLKLEAMVAPLPERRLLRQCVIGNDESGLPLIGPCPGQNVEDNEMITTDTELGIFVKTTAKLTIPIYTFGKVAHAQKAARAGLDGAEAGLDLARAELDFMVRKAYWGAQLAEAALDVLNDGSRRMNDALRDIQKDLDKEGGHYTSIDKHKLIIDQADIEAHRFEVEALLEQAYEGLRVAAGLDVGAPFRLASLDLKPVQIDPRSLEEYIELAMTSRPEMRVAEATLRAREHQVDMEIAEFYPNIALVGSVNFAKGTSADDNPDPFANDPYNSLGWGAVLGAELKLNFAEQISKVNQAKADAAKARAEYDALQQKIRISMAELYGSLNRYEKELEIRKNAMKSAKAWMIADGANSGMGIASSANLVKSFTAYSKARIAYYQTVYEYNLAVAKLSQGVGVELVLPDDEDGQASKDE